MRSSGPTSCSNPALGNPLLLGISPPVMGFTLLPETGFFAAGRTIGSIVVFASTSAPHSTSCFFLIFGRGDFTGGEVSVIGNIIGSLGLIVSSACWNVRFTRSEESESLRVRGICRAGGIAPILAGMDVKLATELHAVGCWTLALPGIPLGDGS